MKRKNTVSGSRQSVYTNTDKKIQIQFPGEKEIQKGEISSES